MTVRTRPDMLVRAKSLVRPGNSSGLPSRELNFSGWMYAKSHERPNVIPDELNTGAMRTLAAGVCRSFDGVNDYIHCGDVTQVSGAGALSVFAWIKPSAATVGDICSKFSASTPLRAFRLIRLAGGQIRAFVCDDGTGAAGHYKQANTTATVSTGAWAHVGFVFNGTGSTLKIFINGVDQSLTVDVNDPIASIVSTTEPMIIGAYKVGTESWFTGNLFDVRVYTRALSDAEVSALYNSTRTSGGDPIGSVSTANLVRHYRLDEQQTGNLDIPPAYCSAGSGVHGRMYGASLANIVTAADVPISYDNEVGYSQWSTAAELAANGTLVTTAGVSDFTHANWIKGAGTSAPASDTLTFSVGAGATAYAYFWQTGVVHPVSVGQCVTWEYEVRSVGGPFKFRSWVSNNSGVYPSIRTAANYTITYQAVDSDWLRVTLSSEAIGVGNVGDYLAPIIYFYSADHGGGGVTGTFQFRNMKMYRDITLTRQPRLTTAPASDVRGRPVQYTGPAPRPVKMIDSGCVTLDGVNDRLDLSSSLSLTPPYTISCWVYRSASADAMLVVDGAASTGLRILSDKPIADFGASNYRYFGTAITNGVWTHLAISVPTGNAADCSCYMDGIKNQANSLHTGTANLTLSSIGSTAPINGRMADVRVFNSALSQSEVQDVMNDRTTAPIAIEHWPLTEMAANTSYSVGAGGRTLAHVSTAEASLWANRQPKVHWNLTRGYRNSTANGTYRTSDGVRQRWSISGASNLRMGTDKWWVAIRVRPTSIGSVVRLIGCWGSDREWLVQLNTSGQPILALSESGAANQGGMTLTGSPISAGQWGMIFFGVDPALSTGLELSGSVDGGTIVNNSYSQSSVRISTYPFDIAGASGNAEWFPGDISFAAVGRSSSSFDFAAIRNAIWNSGTPLTYSQLNAQQKTDWGLVSWWDGSKLDRSFIDVHGANTLAPVGIPYIPARITGSLAGDGNAVTHPGGIYHNGAETRLDFTNGVANVPWNNGLSIPTAYNYGDTLPAKMSKRRNNGPFNWIKEDQFLLRK